MIIDWQHHWMSEELYRKAGGSPGQYAPGVKDGKTTVFLYDAFYDIEKHLEIMDGAGVDIAVLTSGQASLEECRLWDDRAAEVVEKYPERFIAFTPASPLGGKEAFDEIDRAVNGLGFKGVVIGAQVEDRVPLDSPELWPFYRKMSEMGLPIFVHVSGSARGFDAVDALWDSNITLVREFDLATATARLVLGGVLERFPDLKFVMAHLGGGIAAIWERVERYVNFWGPKFWGWGNDKMPLSKPINEYLGMIYFDMAGFEGGMRAVNCALTTISPKRLVFGTDYPPNFVNDPQGLKGYIENIKGLQLDEESKEAMLGGNAAELLGL